MSHARILSWRDLLKNLCNTPQKKQEYAEVCKVSVRTIDRWISGESDPQKAESVRNLSSLSEELKELLQEEWPEAFSAQTKTIPIESVRLPEEFLQRVLHAYSHTSEHAQRWTIFRLVSSQMLAHLDPEQLGLMIVSVRSEKNETLQIFEAAGSALWTTRQVLSQDCKEPWIVEAVKGSCPFFVPSLTNEHPSASCFANKDCIQSVGFFPLYRAGRVGGGILLLSTQPDFFTPPRQTLIEGYSTLLALAFRDADFHE